MMHELLDASFLVTVKKWLRLQRVKGQLYGRDTIITMNTLINALEYCQSQYDIYSSEYHKEMGLRIKRLLDDLMQCPFVCNVKGRVVHDRTRTGIGEGYIECYKQECDDCA